MTEHIPSKDVVDLLYTAAVKYNGRGDAVRDGLPALLLMAHDEIKKLHAVIDSREKALGFVDIADETVAYPHNPPDGCLDCLKVERGALKANEPHEPA